MFGFIKKLFGGVFAFLGGLFGGKKSKDSEASAPKAKKSKGGFYLELDDTGNVKSETAEAKKPESAKLKLATAEPPKAEAPAPAPAAPAPVPVAAPAATTPADANLNGRVETVVVEQRPSQPVAATNGKAPAQAESTCAPQYLTPVSTGSRRRPGPSLDTFRNMARQVKTPS
ncbi:MAG TPA: hypothetical protein V6C95_13170 [Coleofasciculaceae cyanobacterium]